jgi:hypothetical protein
VRGEDAGELGAAGAEPLDLCLETLSVEARLSVPTRLTLCRQGPARILLWATESGHTSLLRILPDDRAAAGLRAALLCSPFEPNLGVVLHALPVPVIPSHAGDGDDGGPDGSAEAELILACGVGADGCLRACGGGGGLELEAVADGGPRIPGCVRMFAVAARGGEGVAAHTHLVLSFDAESVTRVMRIEGRQFAFEPVPGLDEAAATLLADTSPAGHVVQARPAPACSRPSAAA